MKKLFIISISLLGLVSCGKFLEEYSENELIPRRVEHFGEILFSEGYPNQYSTIHPWIVFLSDDVQCYFGPSAVDYVNFITAVREIYQWQPTFNSSAGRNGITTNMNAWATYYKQILGANVVLQHLDGAEGSPALRDQYKGEALALRAYYHFMLVNLYARPYNDSTTTPDKSPGVPVRVTANLSDAYQVRQSVKEVYDQIVSDLDSAIVYLEKGRQRNDIFRITDLAAHLLASRVFLYMGDWERSIMHADIVVQQHPQLMEYADWAGEPPTEDKMLLGPDNVESLWCYGDYKEMLPREFGTTFEVSHDLYNAFEPGDMRSTVAIAAVPPILKPFVAVEFQQFKAFFTSDPRLRINNSWRSAEAYLNRAEAYAQLYRTKGTASASTEALQSLNTLREKRFESNAFQPWVTMPADELLEKCRQERRRELFLEGGHRWFDLRRYGMPEIRHSYWVNLTTEEHYTLRKRDPQYVIPIPEAVHERNPLLERNATIPGFRQPD